MNTDATTAAGRPASDPLLMEPAVSRPSDALSSAADATREVLPPFFPASFGTSPPLPRSAEYAPPGDVARGAEEEAESLPGWMVPEDDAHGSIESGAAGAALPVPESAENVLGTLDELNVLDVIRDTPPETPAAIGSDAAATDLAWLDAVEWEETTAPDAASPIHPDDPGGESGVQADSAGGTERADAEALPFWMTSTQESPSDAAEDAPSGGATMLAEPADDSNAPEITAFLAPDEVDEIPPPSEVAGAPTPREEGLAAAPVGDALHEVADRLERIAASLRERSVAELLAANAEDPLELLLTGFALGYSSRPQNPGS
ncbi:hypothetical protein BH23GEM3_BH23GEM3_12180 [soil metagenome]|nr:hypothetical protein [Gemmatimonadota bacterium]